MRGFTFQAVSSGTRFQPDPIDMNERSNTLLTHNPHATADEISRELEMMELSAANMMRRYHEHSLSLTIACVRLQELRAQRSSTDVEGSRSPSPAEIQLTTQIATSTDRQAYFLREHQRLMKWAKDLRWAVMERDEIQSKERDVKATQGVEEEATIEPEAAKTVAQGMEVSMEDADWDAQMEQFESLAAM